MLVTSDLKSRRTLHILGALLCCLLTAMYGAVPASPELFGIGPRAAQLIQENITGAAILIAIIVTLTYATRNLKVERKPLPVHPIAAVLIFIGGVLWFREFNWVDVREGSEGTISGVFRILWFVVIISLDRSKLGLGKRAVYVAATLILMFVDQSRTYFLIALLVLLADLGVIAILPAIVMALLVAAIRSNENYGLFYAIMFAVGGEGYLGSQGVFQVLSIGAAGVDFKVPAVQALFSPFTAFLVLIFKRLGYPAESFDSSSFLGYYIFATTGQTYPPMGGFFILSEFIRAGWFGMICMAIYMTIVFFLTKRLFDTVQFPIGSFLILIAIKSSPMTYWSLVMSVFIVSTAFRTLSRMAHSIQAKGTPEQPLTAGGRT